jgi:hypothetical protein
VAVVQYTFTHKQYTEYRERKKHKNKKKILGKCGPCSVFARYTLAFALQMRKRHGKTSVREVEKCPDIPVAVVPYTFTHKQYTEYRERNIHNNKKKRFGKCAQCPVFASYTLALALHLRKNTENTQLFICLFVSEVQILLLSI